MSGPRWGRKKRREAEVGRQKIEYAYQLRPEGVIALAAEIESDGVEKVKARVDKLRAEITERRCREILTDPSANAEDVAWARANLPGGAS